MLRALLIFAWAVAGMSQSQSTNQPSQVHIALAGSDGMAVSYMTVEDSASAVKYGLKSQIYDQKADGKSSSYWRTFHHHIVLTNLEPNTKYYYIVGCDEGGWSQEYSFTSAPSTSNQDNSFSFAVWGDLGIAVEGHEGNSTIEYLKASANSYDLLLHAGDVGYADDSFLHFGCATKFCYEDVWDQYMVEMEPLVSHIPYMTLPGNHEVECHSPNCLTSPEKIKKLSNFTAYNTRMRMPSEESGGVLNMWHSFDYKNVHFVNIDTETGFPGAAEEHRYVLPCGGFGNMLQWLENDLAKANKNRGQQPWIIVSGHHPMYQGNSVNKEFQASIEKLFHDYEVDIYFSGHVHHYERNWPVYQDQVPSTDPATAYQNPRDTTYVMIGGAGNDEMDDSQVSDPSPNDKTGKNFVGKSKWRESDDSGPWTASVDQGHFGIGLVNIVDDQTLKFSYVRTTTGEVYDSFTLVREHL
jgi:hypothetical protein